MKLRRATMADARHLFEWRNDPATRAASHNTEPVEWESHLAWLERAIHDRRELLIAEVNGEPIGTVRRDSRDGETELSWTIAPEHRGKGLGKRMVALGAQGPCTAQIKESNRASIRIAESVGMELIRVRDGMLYFWLSELPKTTRTT